MNAPSHAGEHTHVNDAVGAVEEYVGTDPLQEGDTSSLTYRIATETTRAEGAEAGLTYQLSSLLVRGPTPSGDVTGATDTAAFAALAGAGVQIVCPYYPTQPYYVTSMPRGGPDRGIEGIAFATVFNHVGGGSCLTIRNPSFPVGGSPPPVWTDNMAGKVGGFIIDGTSHTGTAAVGVEAGDIYGINAQDILVRNYTAANDAAYWLNNTIGWTERANWYNCHFDNCTNGVVWDVNGGAVSNEFCNYDFSGRSQANQNGYAWKNGVVVTGGKMSLKGNFFGGVTNTGTALLIGADNTPVVINPKLMDIAFETDGAAGLLGHKTLTFSTNPLAHFRGIGTLDFNLGSPVNWRPGSIAGPGTFNFTGVTDIDSTLGSSITGEGLSTYGGSSWNKGISNVTGSGPATATAYVSSGDYSVMTLASGSNQLVLASTSANRAHTVRLFLTQPSSGAAGTIDITAPGPNQVPSRYATAVTNPGGGVGTITFSDVSGMTTSQVVTGDGAVAATITSIVGNVVTLAGVTGTLVATHYYSFGVQQIIRTFPTLSLLNGARQEVVLSTPDGLNWFGAPAQTAQVLYKVNAFNVPMGLSGSYGTPVVSTPGSPSSGLLPVAVGIVWDGSVSGDTFNAQIIATYSDGTTSTLTLPSLTAIPAGGSQTIEVGQLATLFKNGVYVTQLQTAAKTSQASTSLTCALTVLGQNVN